MADTLHHEGLEALVLKLQIGNYPEQRNAAKPFSSG